MSKELLLVLTKEGLIEYGSVIPAKRIREIVGITPPSEDEVHDMSLGEITKVINKMALEELTAVDYVRNILLGRGMYLTNEKGDYRILLPSENKRQVELYMSSADRKLSRALKLSRNSPRDDSGVNMNELSVRAMMKRENIRSSRHN